MNVCELFQCSGDTAKLDAAMLGIQAELIRVARTGIATVDDAGGERPFKHATLEEVWAACCKVLADIGVRLQQHPISDGAAVVGVVTRLSHPVSGQWQQSVLFLPAAMSHARSYGACITYARRYTIQTIAGIVIEGEDDDARSVPEGPRAARSPQRFTPPRLDDDSPQAKFWARFDEWTGLKGEEATKARAFAREAWGVSPPPKPLTDDECKHVLMCLNYWTKTNPPCPWDEFVRQNTLGATDAANPSDNGTATEGVASPAPNEPADPPLTIEPGKGGRRAKRRPEAAPVAST
jgi:hypothetical protein